MKMCTLCYEFSLLNISQYSHTHTHYLSGITVSSTADSRSNENDKIEQTSAVKCVSTSV